MLIKTPYCPKCDKNVEDIIIYNHPIYSVNDETEKRNGIVMPYYSFIQHETCGHVFAVVDCWTNKREEQLNQEIKQ